MFRFCLVGFGRWGKVYYETINRLDFCTLDCIVASGNNVVDSCDVGVPVFYDIKKVMESRRVDGFIIVTPPAAHFNLASICLANKYPVLVEKPFTENYQQASLLVEIAKKNNTMCMVGYQHLFSENYLSLKNSIDFRVSNLLIYSEGLGNGPFRNDVSVLRDWGSHELSVAIDFFHEVPVSYKVKKIAGDMKDSTKGIYYAELKFSHGRRYLALFGNTSAMKRRILIASHNAEWGYLNGLDQGGCVFMTEGSIINPGSILSKGTLPLDLMLNEFVIRSELKRFDDNSLNYALEIVSLLDKIECEMIMENSSV